MGEREGEGEREGRRWMEREGGGGRGKEGKDRESRGVRRGRERGKINFSSPLSRLLVVAV